MTVKARGSDRWIDAVRRFEAMSEEDVDVLIARADGWADVGDPSLDENDWLLLAVIALDQGGADLERTEVIAR